MALMSSRLLKWCGVGSNLSFRNCLQHTQTAAVPKTRHHRPRIVNYRGSNKPPSLFSNSEMERRLKHIREYMVTAGLKASIFTSYHNVNYFSGFLYTAFGRPYGLVVTPDKCITISAAIDGGHPWRRSYQDNITYTDWNRDNFYYAIKEVIGETKGKIGLEFDSINFQMLQKFNEEFPFAEKEDVAIPSMYLRLIKSEAEILHLKEGARIADIGGAAIVNALREGATEYKIAQAGTAAMVKEIAKRFPDSDLMDTWTWFQSGPNTDGAHNPLTARQIKKGEILSLNCFPMIGGYYSALERTLFLDHASDDHLRIWEANCHVHQRGLKLIRPGARCCDIADELNDLYAEYGLLDHRSFGYGHSFGMLCHYYGREAALELREDVTTTLQPGMVLSMEPMIFLPPGMKGAGGYREHNMLVVTRDGSEDITAFPYGPEHLIIRK